ncbi:ATP-dependent Clp protease ATP-binding subunit ClpC [Kibdelosporangium banguiense]|uniref:ATP-dependent Clp protease ATP-binding subunit ClpC n=1 Tax=Kibdelosporangium banguiense TaxID=1365924 RepID=A0ABS4U1H0_9PSEU|nr:Clp protease N-terminal domain-containing protein [Kibdelosporangium banguiense]MBP2330069.1 ATP-dependent Clp protease ATP-binding subunit ClpC [Kibdelosporangium banguiense]
MPKVNVYLPDELADAVRAANLPLSAICQRALEQSVKRVTAIRAAVLSADPTAGLSQFTDRAKTVIKMAVGKAQADGAEFVGTEHLLHAMLAEGSNLALRVLQALEIAPAHVAQVLTLPTGSGSATQFSSAAANALELTVTEAISLGHNYVGCEHLLLGLLSEPDGTAGATLREVGADLKSARATVAAALVGYAHLRAQPANSLADVIKQELRPVIERIERLEQRATDN